MIRNVGIVLAGGIGSRFGGDKPKQYYLLKGKEIISYAINAFKDSEKIDAVLVVLDKEEYFNGRIKGEYQVYTTIGGNTRNESFKNALDYIKEHFPDCDKIVENNAACPLVTTDLIDKYIDYLDEYDCVSTTYKITDALARYDNIIVNREDYYLIQTPDAYRFKLLYNYFDVNSLAIHPAHQLPNDRKEKLYFDFKNNIKITYPEDIRKAEIFLDMYNDRV